MIKSNVFLSNKEAKKYRDRLKSIANIVERLKRERKNELLFILEIKDIQKGYA